MDDIRAYRQARNGAWIRQWLGVASDGDGDRLKRAVLICAGRSIDGEPYRIELNGRIVATMNKGRAV